ncbi:vacuolar protein sorting-associated protein 54-like isoform X2 [Paramacrobiotus metropolitanus]|uniref:vacuolar protein sorting-associated protein 54-like isoform X2 n=1 Tax=Paramacrobiotus metropolitanus TaxID=2943436 RepID=UPI0024464E2A|nr:vacuolar protein sorting-associated protein 54-like isoform X2 [Paramacrobiotus metropolitanus]
MNEDLTLEMDTEKSKVQRSTSIRSSQNPFDEDESNDNHSHPRTLSRGSSIVSHTPFDEPDSRPISRLSRSSTITSLGRHPSLQEDLPQRVFNFYDTSVNLPAVLNDPRKPRPIDFLTRTWGEGFMENSVRPSPRLDEYSIDDFRPYMRCINVREALLKGTRSTPDSFDRRPSHSVRSPRPTSENPLENIPAVYLAQTLDLENPQIFRQICPVSLADREARRSIQGLRDRCAQWLDIVESEIAKTVSLRAEAFFTVVTSHDLLQDRIEICQNKASLARQRLQTTEKIIQPYVQTVALAQKRFNLNRTMHKLQTVLTISQTQATIQMLLASGDFVGALDLITTTRDIVGSELSGLHCFRHLGTQLSEMEKFIDKMMSLEFRRALSAHLNRSFDGEESSQKMQEAERFAAIVTGLLRQRRFNVVDWFREEALSALQITMKFAMISSTEDREVDVDDKEEMSAEEEGKTLPYHLLKSLDFSGLVDLFVRMQQPLREMLLRIRAAHDVIYSLECDNQESRTGGVDDGGLTALDFSRLRTQLQELLFAVGEETQEEIARILSKSPGWKDLKLHNDSLASLWEILQHIMKDGEDILGVKMTLLNAQLQKLAFAFVGRFHEDRRQKLTLILDSERWTPTEIPVEFQSYVENIITSQTFRVSIPRHSSNDSFALNGSTEDAPKSPVAVVPYLEIQGEFFVVVGTVVILLRMLGEYAALMDRLPASMNISGDILLKIVEILKMFNSRTCQLVLGAGAMHSAGLKSITSKNLTLSSRCLQLIGFFIPIVRDDLSKRLSSKQKHLTKNFETLARDIDTHCEEIDKKLLQIFDAQLIGNFARWEATTASAADCKTGHFQRRWTTARHCYLGIIVFPERSTQFNKARGFR